MKKRFISDKGGEAMIIGKDTITRQERLGRLAESCKRNNQKIFREYLKRLMILNHIRRIV